MKKKNMKKQLLLAGMALTFLLAGTMTSMAKERLDTPSELYWSNSTKKNDDGEKEGTVARWEEVDHAKKYEIKLYYDEESVVATVESKKPYTKLRNKMTKEGEYSFKVRAVGSGSYSTGYWSEMSDTYYLTQEALEHSGEEEKTASLVYKNEWIQTDGKWKFRRSDGSFASAGWFQDPADQKWYYMDAEGCMMTGWVEDGGRKYYMDPAGTPSGSMAVGERSIDGVTYHFAEDGALAQ